MTTRTPTIAEQAQTITVDAATRLPNDVSSAFAADRATLDAHGVPAEVATPGTALPDAELLDVNSAPTTLGRLRGDRPAVVVLYRGAWCPYCNIALRTYQTDLVPALTERGVELIAVSPQKPDGSLSSVERNELTFTVASDPGNQLAAALGVLTRPSADSLAAQRSLGLDLTEVNADGQANVPMPTVLVVDGTGVIRWIDVHPNYATRSEVADILVAVDAMERTGV
ncbi:peroxiredoxin-like family protein [Mycolicibacterium sp. 050158]|uniref:peroxiredoxin-like family protein n=1 Tax=Mycolicibacterium sp. 050158 TaxID=3090602 RepID=UPI00299D4028|nr:peroxiredoxin-like family protein [Mycolicibacterium sp. 050158]MDX1891639.1 peroxiredoxin-like family protein [Mycolicibacterium sp. 050158]